MNSDSVPPQPVGWTTTAIITLTTLLLMAILAPAGWIVTRYWVPQG